MDIQFGEFQAGDFDPDLVEDPPNVNEEDILNGMAALDVDDDPPLSEVEEAEQEVVPPPLASKDERPVSLDKLLRIAAEQARTDGKFTAELADGQDDLEQQLENWLHNIGTMFYATRTTDQRHKAIAANKMLGGRAFLKIRKMSTVGPDGNPQLPSYDEIVRQLRLLVKGTTPGDGTITIRLIRYCFRDAGVVSARRHGHPDLQAEVQQFMKELDKRSTPPDSVTVCALLINAFRNLPEIQEQIRQYQDEDGVRVEQDNPEHLIRTLQQFNDKYRDAVVRAMKTAQPTPMSPHTPAQNGKRPGGPSTGSQVGKSQQAGPSKKAKTQHTAVNPFQSGVKDLQHAPKDTSGYRLWIKGSTNSERMKLSKEGKCWLCKKAGHMVTECPSKKDRFTKQEFCFYKQ